MPQENADDKLKKLSKIIKKILRKNLNNDEKEQYDY